MSAAGSPRRHSLLTEEAHACNPCQTWYGERSRVGVRRTLETLLNHLEDRLFDLVNLTDTYTKVQQADLKVDSVNQAEAAPYFPTRGRAYRKALAHFALPTDGGFVDLGSGKGKILILSARYGFRRVVGVEFARHLSDIADRTSTARATA